MERQVKSKDRVAEFGEVFTAEREVKAMCDMVADECARIDSRILEPACGDGNFLAEILTRKLSVVESKYKKSSYDSERNSILALTGIYGVDIMADNVEHCRNRLYSIWEHWYIKCCKGGCNDKTRLAARAILNTNIVCGNALSMMCVDDKQQEMNEFIVFPEWTFPFNDSRIKRRDFRLDVLLKENHNEDSYDGQIELFSDSAMAIDNWVLDPVKNELVPKPIKEYPLVHYRRIGENGGYTSN